MAARRAPAALRGESAASGWRSRIVGHGEEAPDQLLANPRNWRIHPKAQQDALTGLLDQVGWVQDVIVNRTTGHVVDGHLRVAVAISRGEATVPVVYVELSPEDEGLVLASLDPLSAMAVTDSEALRELLGDVDAEDSALQAMLDAVPKAAKVGLTEPDDVPEERAETSVQRGDVYVLGRHRLMCGDATDAADVAALLDGAEPHLCVTDPPYGVNYDPSWRNVEAAKGNLAYSASRVGEVTNDDRADWAEAWALVPGDVIYSWHPAGATSLIHAKALQDSGFTLRMQIIWAKSNFPIGRGDYHVRHEPCWYAVRNGKPSLRNDDRTQSTLWEINLDKNVEGGHSTQKPVECMERPIRNHTGDVYEPFAGSGTTIIAAERQSRRCYAMEIEPKYCAVSIERWQNYTGQVAINERTGEPYEVGQQRAKPE